MNRKAKKGMTIIEILVALGIVSLGFFAINYLVLLGFQTNVIGVSYTKGILYAQEGLEVMRILKNQDWQNNIAPLNPGTSYYPVLSGSTWSLQTTSPGLIDNLFARIITVEDVYRDTDDNIASSGTLDPNTKKVTVTLSWQHSTGQKVIAIPAYIANIANT